jgi:SAM-dependent methyltransferase
MIERDGIFVEERRRFFEEEYGIVQSDDSWHLYTRRIVDSTTKAWYDRFGSERGPRILNAGSGGRTHGISAPMTHLDLVESKLVRIERRMVGNVSAIPSPDESFDVVICVGSVINYADPLCAIREFSRILRTGGLLILEYERSASFEHLCRYPRWQSCLRVKTFYGSLPTQLWVYGDGFIDGLLSASGLRPICDVRFHALSSVILAVTNSPKLASWFTCGDRLLAQFWPLRSIASNRILAIEKPAD